MIDLKDVKYEGLADFPDIEPATEPLDEPPAIVPNITDSVELKITLSTEDAIHMVYSLLDIAAKFIQTAWDIAKSLCESVLLLWPDIYSNALRSANDNPRYWHLYRYAKKKRIREKYRKILERQLLESIAAKSKE